MPENFWVLCGKTDHWNIALKDEIWGLIPKFKGKWKFLRRDDYLFFYATSPVAGIIGLGRAQAKFKQNQPLWPDEIQRKEVLYPFRFEFTSEYILPEKEWARKKIKISLPIGFYSGMNLLDDQDIIDNLRENINKQWGVMIELKMEDAISKLSFSKEQATIEPQFSHDKVKDMIFIIGKMHRYITDKEYEINSERLDVVWRRVEKSVPTYAFEIQIGGDIYHALAKLKHAYDLWNSNIYIVLDDEHLYKAEELLSGTFHEIRNILRIINLKSIQDLYSLQTKDAELRQRIGLP